MPNYKNSLSEMKKHTLDGIPYYPRDELPSAVDDAADVMSKYKKAVSEHETRMKKYRKIWKEKGFKKEFVTMTRDIDYQAEDSKEDADLFDFESGDMLKEVVNGS